MINWVMVIRVAILIALIIAIIVYLRKTLRLVQVEFITGNYEEAQNFLTNTRKEYSVNDGWKEVKANIEERINKKKVDYKVVCLYRKIGI